LPGEVLARRLKGILISNLGESLLCQFPEISFHEERFPYVRTVKDARKTLEYIWEAETEYVARYNTFKEVNGAQQIEAPMPEGLGIRLDDSLPFYFAATANTVIALGTGRMTGTTITYSPRRDPGWKIERGKGG